MSSDVAPVSTSHSVRLLRIAVECDARRYVFDLGPRDLRAIVIGEMTGADVRIKGSGYAVPEIACHLEREGDAIYLVPGYARDIQVDGVAITGVCVLPWHSRVSFSGVHLTVNVSERGSGAQVPAAG